MKKILFLITAIAFGKMHAQTCEGTDPGMTAGNTSCVTLTYGGSTTEYTTVRAADGNIWLQQNLGSNQIATSATDAAAFGDYYQWGRWQDGHEKSTSAMGNAVTPNNPLGIGSSNNTFIPTWWNVVGSGDAWNASSPENISDASGCDPCKAALGNGCRLPTEAEWITIIETEGITNIATAYNSNLKLATAGYRGSTGGFTYVAARGYYWSSTPSSGTTNYGKYLYYSNAVVNGSAGGPRGQAASIRCIKGIAEAPVATPTGLTIMVQGNADTSITTDNGTLQLISIVTPANANQGVIWSIASGSEFASVSGNGLVTALGNGTVTIEATSTEVSSVTNTITITISNQVILPQSLQIATLNSVSPTIGTDGDTLQLNAVVLPANADQSVTWSITSGSELASVDSNGLVTAIANGTVTVQAVSTVDETILNTIEILISGQYVAPTGIEISVADNDAPSIITAGGNLQLVAEIQPTGASQDVTWSITQGNELALLDANGLLAAIADGIVTIQAVSNDDETLIDTIEISIINQNIASAAPYCQAEVDYNVEPISNVVFADISNATSAEINTTSSYENFTAITGNVVKGQTYTLIVEGNNAGLFAHDIRVFIDWNIDNSFDMATEYYATTLENTTGADGVQALLEITVPETAVTGTTRLRITKDMWNVYEPGEFDACTNAYYGQVEDYSLNVTANPTTGLDDHNKVAFTVSPNPTNGLVTITAATEVTAIEVYNLTGQLIATAKDKHVNLSQAADGMYIMKIQFAGGSTATQKILKSN